MKLLHKQLIIFLALITQSVVLHCMETESNICPFLPKEIVLHVANFLDITDASNLFKTCKTYNTTVYAGEFTTESIKKIQFGIAQWLKRNPEKCKNFTQRQHFAAFSHYSQTYNSDMIEFLIHNENTKNREKRIKILEFFGYIKKPQKMILLDEIYNPLYTIKTYNGQTKHISASNISRAIDSNNITVLKIMLTNDLQFMLHNYFLDCLLCSVKAKDIYFTQYLLNHSNRWMINSRYSDGLTPLHKIAQTSNIDVANLLLCHKVKVNTLSQAPYTKDLHKKRIYKSNLRHLTPLHIACKHGSINMVNVLLKNNADVHVKSGDDSYTFATLEYYDYLNCFYGPNYKNGKHTQVSRNRHSKISPLHLAAYYNHIDIMDILINNNADIHSKDSDGNTPLHYACDNLQTDAIKILILKNANVNATNDKNQSPLLLILEKYHMQNSDDTKTTTLTIVYLLLKAGANPNLQDIFSFKSSGSFCTCNKLDPMKNLIKQYHPNIYSDCCIS